MEGCCEIFHNDSIFENQIKPNAKSWKKSISKTTLNYPSTSFQVTQKK
jgi:hypothetical protein